MERKLYSLEAINSKCREDRYTIKVKNRLGQYEEKVYLSNIDEHITTYFKNLDQFLYYLKQKGIIASKYDSIKITYRHNGIQTLDPIFKENEILNKISKNAKTKIDLEKNKKEFIYILDQFFNLCENEHFCNILLKSHQIPQKLKDGIKELNNIVYTDKTPDEIKYQISEILINYKILRTIVVYIDGYINNKKIPMQTTLPPKNENGKQITLPEDFEVVYDREEKEEFFSEEELKSSYG